ncbi:MAG: hypothetical protein U0X20_00515 [Caldilineaceae bacterium]
MSPQLSSAPGSGDDGIQSALEFLRGRGDWIGYKFDSGEADAIEASDLQEIITEIGGILPQVKKKDRALARRLENIQDSCFAGKRLLREDKLNKYFEHLRSLADQLRWL